MSAPDTGPAAHDAAMVADGALDAGRDAATPTLDAGVDAVVTADAGHDAAVATPDAGMDAAAPIDAGNDAATLPDANVDAGNDAGNDAGPDAGNDASAVTTCNPPGRIGAHCAGTACSVGGSCLQYSPMTTQVTFGLAQGRDDVAHPGYSAIEMPAIASESAPFNAAEGSLCAQQCDTSVADTCGACTTCANVVTQMPLLAAFGGASTLFGATATYGANTGLCRLDCSWDPTTRGAGCPDASFTCDAFSGTCVEACTTDTECNTTYGATYQGELVTALVTSHPEHCNLATGRCEANATATVPVGALCTSSDACTPGSGICLNGGMCAQFGCTPGATGASLCGASGICLGTNESSTGAGLCLKACISRGDCAPGNVCRQLGVSIGPYTGYCIGACDLDSECAPSETCTDSVDSGGAPVAGRCVPRCTGVGLVGAASGGCAATEFCRADHTGATYGSCVTVDPFCGAANTVDLPAASTDCATGYVCDETLATPHTPIGAVDGEVFGDGHCRPTCATTACTGGLSCVPTGVLAGLCRRPCSASSSTCPTDQTCNTTLGYCVEVTTM